MKQSCLPNYGEAALLLRERFFFPNICDIILAANLSANKNRRSLQNPHLPSLRESIFEILIAELTDDPAVPIFIAQTDCRERHSIKGVVFHH